MKTIDDRVPQVSVLMTVFNTAAYLAEAIESVLAQSTPRAWELLIVDDGSSDASLAIAQRFAARFPRRIRVLQHPRADNRGISASRNLALRHARGNVIAFLDSDDVWFPSHLERLLPALEQRPDVAMVYAAAERWVDFDLPFDEAASRASGWGRNYLPPLLPGGERSRTAAPGELLGWFAADDALVPCICSVVVRAEAARAVGGFSEEFRGLYDDQAFHAKLSRRYAVHAMDVCVARYRQHDRSCCATARRDVAGQSREHERFRQFLAGQLAPATTAKA